MNVLIVTNVCEHKGLYYDSQILAKLLLEYGHKVVIVDFREETLPIVDLTIHLEVVKEHFFRCSVRHWWIPNAEWCYSEYLNYIDKFELILCKTKDAERIFRSLTPKAIYTGFTTEDKYDPTVKRERKFFHACHDSSTKGTDAVLSAHARMGFPLYIPKKVSDEEMKLMQNTCLFHLQPSQYEGYGLSINEGLSCGAIVVSTDHPPMNEFKVARLIKPVLTDVVKLAIVGIVNPEGVVEAVKWCQSLTDAEIKVISDNARESYLKECEQFRLVMKGLLS